MNVSLYAGTLIMMSQIQKICTLCTKNTKHADLLLQMVSSDAVKPQRCISWPG